MASVTNMRYDEILKTSTSPLGLQWTGTWRVQNRLRDFLHYQVGHWLALLRWATFNCNLCFLICSGTLFNAHPHPTGMWSRLQASLLVTQNVRRWECYILWGQRNTSSWAHPQVWNGRNQLAHGLTFLSKVPLEVCGQGCVTEEAPEEWSSFNSSHAFVPLCICASFHLSLFRTKGQQTPSEYYQL